jgi:hypothetical protein
VQGFHILLSIPDSGSLILPPHPLNSDCILNISNTLAEVRTKFHADKSILETWNIWESLYLPQSLDANNYVKQLANSGIPYYNPISLLLYKSNKELPLATSTIMGIATDDVPWPDVLSAALNSVNSRFNTEHSNPRIYVVADAQLTLRLQLWKSSTISYYNQLFARSRVIDLQSVIRRKLSFDGEIGSVGGSKDTLIKTIKDMDYSFVSIFQKQISSLDLEFIEDTIGNASMVDEISARENVVKIKEFFMSRESLRAMVKTSMNREHINAIIQLLMSRDAEIGVSHQHVHGNNRSYKSFVPSMFLDCTQTNMIITGDLKLDIRKVNYYRIYFVDDINGIIMFVSLSDHKIYFINTSLGNSELKDGPYEILKRTIGKKIVQFLNSNQLVDSGINFILADYPYQYFERQIIASDFGVYVYCILYFLVTEVPISFSIDDIHHIKNTLAYYMMIGSLPY